MFNVITYRLKSIIFIHILSSFSYHMLLMRHRSKISLLTSMFVFGITINTTLAQSLVRYNFDIDFAINAYAQQKYSSSLDIPGKVVNSKYLHITDQKYIQGKLGYDTISGIVVNNVAKNISFATIYAALYDKNNTFITMESGFVSVSLLNPGGKSPFAIDIFGVKDVDHYTLF